MKEERGRDQGLKASNTNIIDVGVFVFSAALEDSLRERLGGSSVGGVVCNARRHGCVAEKSVWMEKKLYQPSQVCESMDAGPKVLGEMTMAVVEVEAV